VTTEPVPDELAGRIERELRQRGVADVRGDRHARMLYATDASIYQVEPLAVVVVGSEREAQTTVEYCRDRAMPILPRGGGTALAGQSVNRAVILDFSAHCRRILSVDVEARRAWVEPGVVLDQLNAHLEPRGLMFGPDVATSSHANLGGMIGNNSAGAHSLVYGRTVEHLLGLEVLLADGRRMRLEQGSAERDPRQREIATRLEAIVRPLAAEIDRRFPKIRRHVDGYNLDILLRQLRESTPGSFDQVNLASLVCGSEGTLAITLRAHVALVERPRARALAIISFRSADEALQALRPILAEGPAAVELVDEVVIETALLNLEHRDTVAMLPTIDGRPPGAVLYVEFFGDSAQEADGRLESLPRILPDAPIGRFTDERSRQRAWRLRKAGEPLLHAVPGDRKPVTFVEDTAVDPSRLLEFVREFRAIVERHGTRAAYYAHASVGCLHIRPLVDIRSDEDRGRMVSIATEVAELVRRHDGALSGEHGDGRVRTPLLARVMGRELCDAFRRVKEVFDPRGLLNPGNIVGPSDPLRILDHHRVRPQQEFTRLPGAKEPTFFRYEREGGFNHATEQCNGAGICRRMSQGAMCPSYRATLDERHSTRGRGNALRLAITGQFGGGTAPSWQDESTHETLRLCLSCKACRSECPSNVDIAKLKAEYLAQSFRDAGRVPLRTRLVGRIRRVSRVGSALWPIANAAGRVPGARALLAAIMDVDSRREPIRFGPSLVRWDAKRRAAARARRGSMPREPAAPHAPTVLVMADCFSAFQEPTIGRAVVELLEAFGYCARVVDAGCCGRSLISAGMLAEAARVIGATARRLDDEVRRHDALAIVIAEPSCQSAVIDEWRELRLADRPPEIERVADRALAVDAFLDSRWDAHPRRPRFDPLDAPVLVHAHCHQRALLGAESAVRLLRRCFGERVELLDSGCCGMAGSFGYTGARYDLSMRIAEQSLLALLRGRGAGDGGASAHASPIVVAAGTSCRQQVRDGIGAQPLHPADLCMRVLRNARPGDRGAAPAGEAPRR